MNPSNNSEAKPLLTLMLTQDHRSADFKNYCRDLLKKLPHIKIIRKDISNDQPPCIKLTENLRFFSLPESMEWSPFTEAIDYLRASDIQMPEDMQSRVKAIKKPATLRLFISGHCVTCPPRVRQLIPLTFLNLSIRLDIIDVSLFPEIGEANGIQGVPTLIIDDCFRWAGKSPLDEIVDVLSTGDINSLKSSTIEEMLRYGGAYKIAKMVLHKKKLFPQLADFMIDEKFSTRLGAMAVSEELLKHDGDMAAELVNSLWKSFLKTEDQFREDILYLLGVSVEPEAMRMLQSVRDGDYSQHLKQAATEIMEGEQAN